MRKTRKSKVHCICLSPDAKVCWVRRYGGAYEGSCRCDCHKPLPRR
jgi:hypothetical protein